MRLATRSFIIGLLLGSLAYLTISGCDPEQDVVCPFENLEEVCGDGWCEWTEFVICPEDCVICGDGICDGTETESCSLDCFECGDGVCGDAERGWCISDCHNCSNQETYASMVPCDDVQYCSEDSPCDVCGDGECTWIEDYTMTCPDCPSYDAVCGDGECNWWEVGVCYEDCWMVCGDLYCDEAENADACPEDCAVCGDGHCHPGEELCHVDCFSHGG
jgi:hypothetical protein